MLIDISALIALAALFTSARASCAVYEQWVTAPMRSDATISQSNLPGVNLLFRGTAATQKFEVLAYKGNDSKQPLITVTSATCINQAKCLASFSWQTIHPAFPNSKPVAEAIWAFGTNDVTPYTQYSGNKKLIGFQGFNGAPYWIVNSTSINGRFDNVGLITGSCAQTYTPPVAPASSVSQTFTCADTFPAGSHFLQTSKCSAYFTSTFRNVKNRPAAVALIKRQGFATGTDTLGDFVKIPAGKTLSLYGDTCQVTITNKLRVAYNYHLLSIAAAPDLFWGTNPPRCKMSSYFNDHTSKGGSMAVQSGTTANYITSVFPI